MALGSASAVWKQPFRLPPHLAGTRSFAERENGLPIGARSVAEHARRITEHGRNLAEHGRNLAEHGRNLTEHGRNLAEHERNLAEHARGLRDHGRSLQDTRRRIADEMRNRAVQASGLAYHTCIAAAGIAGSPEGAFGVTKVACGTANGIAHGASSFHASWNRTPQVARMFRGGSFTVREAAHAFAFRGFANDRLGTTHPIPGLDGAEDFPYPRPNVEAGCRHRLRTHPHVL